jgi:redox-regulated HSP33 family molecular chaperone
LRQKISQHRLAQEVTRGVTVPLAGGLVAQILPLVDRGVAAAQPHQCNEVNALILGERADEAGDLVEDRILPVILQHIDHVIIGCVRS